MGRYERHTWPADPTAPTRAQRTPCDFRAYVPEPLSSLALALPATVAADLNDAEQQVRQLNQAAFPFAVNLEPMARLMLRAEAIASSNIEGLRMNVRRLARSEAAARAGLVVDDETARAVLGNIGSLDAVLDVASAAERDLAVQDLLDIHRALLAGTRDEAWGGAVRATQNWIGSPTPCRAAFVPPPPRYVPGLLDDLVSYLNSDDHPALLQAALAHAQFEAIHPFADGNGRTGRALIQFVFRRRGLAPRVVPPVSLVLATDAEGYVRALNGTCAEGEATAGLLDWLELFITATVRSCQDAQRFGVALAELRDDWLAKVGPVRASSATAELLGVLPAMPVFSVTTASAALARSWDAVNDAVARLERAGVIRKVTLGRRNRAFEVVGLFEAFTDFERILASPAADTAAAPPVRAVPARPHTRST